DLGGGDEVMLSDTVGFVRNLPHHLVASFKATLEESIYSDLLLIVLDAADPQVGEHLKTVEHVLKEIGADKPPRLLLLNKVDLLEDNAELLLWQQEHPTALPISAAQGTGLDRVVEAVRQHQRGGDVELTLRIPMSDGKALNFLENRATVHDRIYDNDSVKLRLTMGRRQLDQLRATGARFEIEGQTR
ncbi:MAG: GTPase HflX, partial [Phycisphaeraceae bacterium]